MRPPRICPTCDRLRVACSYVEGSRDCAACRIQAEEEAATAAMLKALPPKACSRCDILCKGSDFVANGKERKTCSLCRLKAREDAERRARG